jgi:hypothetical protein
VLSHPIDRPFGELCDYWLTQVLPQKRYQEGDQCNIRKHLRPAFGHLMIRAIAREQIDQYQAERADKRFANREQQIRKSAKHLIGLWGTIEGTLGQAAVGKIPLLEFDSD